MVTLRFPSFLKQFYLDTFLKNRDVWLVQDASSMGSTWIPTLLEKKKQLTYFYIRKDSMSKTKGSSVDGSFG